MNKLKNTFIWVGIIMFLAILSPDDYNIPTASIQKDQDVVTKQTIKKDTTIPLYESKTVKSNTITNESIKNIKSIGEIKKIDTTQYIKKNNISDCHPSYWGCLKMNAWDYDCRGGSGNGPNYTWKVRVIGYDEFGLDRDKDGWWCE